MGKIFEAFIDIGDIEKLAGNNTLVHRLDPRCKILLTLLFTIMVVSFDRYEVAALIPFFAYPVFLVILAEISVVYLGRKLLFVSFFALMLGIANPILDREILLHIGSLQISGGWVSFTSIMIRFTLTAGVALLLLTTTGMYDISKGLQKLGVPKIFVIQLFFLCRYLFVLTDEALRLVRAREIRSFGKKGLGISVFNNLISTLFMRSVDRAERIYTAMRCRGFDGSIRTADKMKWRQTDTLFMLIWVLLFIFFRFIGFSNYAFL